MFTEDDLRQAVVSGAISAEAADALRNSVRGSRDAPATDEENFRLINSFNDIFVTIAAILLLVAMGGIGQVFTPALDGPPPVSGLLIAGAALATAGAAWLHWRRFMVPITVAAGCAALTGMVLALVVTAVGPHNMGEQVMIPLVFAAGLAVFGFAMRWDTSDRERQTRRSDVAFWLHLLAAPMIAHPLFHWLGVTGGENIGISAAIGVLFVYVALGIVALAIDRRALLVSALAYVLAALTFLFDRFGAVELNVALTALVIGSALLTLSAFWSPIRRAVVVQLPGNLQQRLPMAMLPRPA